MTDHAHYPKAPITEAVIEIRFDGPVSMEKIGSFAKTLKGYPNTRKDVKQNFELTFNTSEPEAAKALEPVVFGFSCTSEDGKQIVQLREDRFALSRLQPYDRWETFRAEAQRLWELCRPQLSEAIKVTRLAVRYINKIDIPLPITDFDDYLNISPGVDKFAKDGLAEFFIHVLMPQNDINAALSVNEGMMPVSSDKFISVILDLDLFRVVEVPQDDVAIWKYFEVLRARKNQLFEDAVTPKAKELFK